MPFIEEDHLVNLHRSLEEKEETVRALNLELRKQRLYNRKIRKGNRSVYWTLAVAATGVLLLSIALLWNPGLIGGTGSSAADNTQASYDSLLMAVHQNREQLSALQAMLNVEDTPEADPGTWYTVQVAALKDQQILPGPDKQLDLVVLEEAPYKKVALGRYTNPKEAESLRQTLEIIGFKDAFVVGYENGVRLQLKDSIHE